MKNNKVFSLQLIYANKQTNGLGGKRKLCNSAELKPILSVQQCVRVNEALVRKARSLARLPEKRTHNNTKYIVESEAIKISILGLNAIQSR